MERETESSRFEERERSSIGLEWKWCGLKMAISEINS